MVVHVEYDKCIGAGMCAMTSPEVFDQDDNGIVTLLPHENDESAEDAVRRAVSVCPSAALSLPSPQ